MYKIGFTLSASFTCLTPRMSQLFSGKKKIVSGLDKVVNFKDFSRPNKDIKYFARTLTEFKDFQDDY